MRPIKSYIQSRHFKYYISEVVSEKISKLSQFVSDSHEIHLFPEATLKSNDMPNGLAMLSLQQDTLLMPMVLRDPGCGFLVFKIPASHQLDRHKLFQLLDSFLKENEMHGKEESTQHILDALQSGIAHLDANKLTRAFTDLNFEPDPKLINLHDLLDATLAKDLNTVTNSLELKYLPSEPGVLLGLIHTGSAVFPHSILKHWRNIIGDYTYFNIHDSVEAINDGIFGISANVCQGQQYIQWLKAAMNFCVYKRFRLFSLLREQCRAQLSIDLELINDRCHAGIFEQTEQGKLHYLQSRGVQPIHSQKSNQYLVAGQRETVSLSFYLDENVKQELPYIGHGTGYVKDDAMDYHALLGSDVALNALESFEKLHANTQKDKSVLLAYTYNTLTQYSHLNKAIPYEILYPVYNYQGPYLRRLNT